MNVLLLRDLLTIKAYGSLPRRTSRADSLNTLIKRDLIRDHGCEYRLTDRGRMFVDFLIATPLPESAWFDPRLDNAIS